MYGRETFLVRMADDSMSPALRAGDYAYVDPAEPAEPGRLVAIHDGSGGTTVRETPLNTARSPPTTSPTSSKPGPVRPLSLRRCT